MQTETIKTLSQTAPPTKKWKFLNVAKANAEIARLESMLASRPATTAPAQAAPVVIAPKAKTLTEQCAEITTPAERLAFARAHGKELHREQLEAGRAEMKKTAEAANLRFKKNQ